METSAEIYSKIDFKSLFRDFNRAKKRKLTQRDKNLIRLLVRRYLPTTTGDMNALQKALSAGTPYPPEGLKKGAALRTESLEATLNMVTFDDKHIKLHKLTSKKKRKKNGKQVVQTTNRIRRRRKLRLR